MPRSQPQILTGTNLSQIINESGKLDSHVQPLCPCSLCYHGRGAGTAVKQGGYSLVILLTREMTFLFNWLFVSCIIHAVKVVHPFFFRVHISGTSRETPSDASPRCLVTYLRVEEMHGRVYRCRVWYHQICVCQWNNHEGCGIFHRFHTNIVFLNNCLPAFMWPE